MLWWWSLCLEWELGCWFVKDFVCWLVDGVFLLVMVFMCCWEVILILVILFFLLCIYFVVFFVVCGFGVGWWFDVLVIFDSFVLEIVFIFWKNLWEVFLFLCFWDFWSGIFCSWECVWRLLLCGEEVVGGIGFVDFCVWVVSGCWNCCFF